MNRFLQSIAHAVKGISVAFATERNLKIQFAVAMLTLSAGFYFDITSSEWCIIIFTIALVLGTEMINTAIESLVDLVKPERHPLAGRVKDVAAGAVLVVSVLAVVIGIVIFKRHIIR